MIPIQDKGEVKKVRVRPGEPMPELEPYRARQLFEWVKLTDGFPEDKKQPNGAPHLIVLRHQFPEWYYTFKILTPNQIADDFKCQNLNNWEWLKPILFPDFEVTVNPIVKAPAPIPQSFLKEEICKEATMFYKDKIAVKFQNPTEEQFNYLLYADTVIRENESSLKEEEIGIATMWCEVVHAVLEADKRGDEVGIFIPTFLESNYNISKK